MVSNIGSGLILNYVNYLSKKNLSLEDMFKQFSASLGGDGNTIKKKDIEDYIKKAERGEVKVSAQKLKYLKMVRDNWERYFKDKDSISYEDFKNNVGLFVGIIAEDTKVEEKEEDKKKEKDYQIKQKDKNDKDDEKLEIFNKYIEELKDKMKAVEKGLTKDNLKEYLTELVTRSGEDSDATAEIGLVTNLISDFDSITGGKEYLNSFKKEIQYESSSELNNNDFSSPVNFKI